MPGQCIHLSIECVEGESESLLQDTLTDDRQGAVHITDEFINDLFTQMEYDEKGTKIRRSTDGKIKFSTQFFLFFC